MLESKDLEKILEDKNKRIHELTIQNEGLDREMTALLEELNVTPEQLSAYIANMENFSDKNWEELQAVKEKLEVKLSTDLSSVRNPHDVAKAYATRNIDGRWLHVR